MSCYYHGESNTKLYKVWKNMRSRCSNPNIPAAKYYLHRGIKHCAAWNVYENFRRWAISAGYKEGLSLDRIDNNGDYTPENCRWATKLEQQRNTRITTRITIEGVTKPLREWAEIFGVDCDSLRHKAKRLNLI